MRASFAVLSDIHSNATALKACLERIKERESELGEPIEVFVAGDTLNAGPDPVGTLELLEPVAKVHLVGNHEDYLAECLASLRPEKYRDPLWRFVPWTINRVGRERLATYLRNLRHRHTLFNHLCSVHHASPESNSRVPEWFPEQSKSAADVPSPFVGVVERLFIVGHSHYSALHSRKNRGELWVNSGSVGFPFVTKIATFHLDPVAVFPLFSIAPSPTEIDVSVSFEQVVYSGSALIRAYAQSGALFECAPYSLAVLCQSLFNLDVNWPAFRQARRRGADQSRMAHALCAYMRREDILPHLERRLVDELGPSAAHELQRAVAPFL